MQWPDLSKVLDPLPWAVAGAVATRAYMPERVTLDLDVVVLAKDASEIGSRLSEAGYKLDAPRAVGGSSPAAKDRGRLRDRDRISGIGAEPSESG